MKRKPYRNAYHDDSVQSFFRFLRWQINRFDPIRTRREIAALPYQQADIEKLLDPAKAGQVTWLGHSSVLFQAGGLNILTDPIFSKRCSPLPFLGPKRLLPSPLTISQLPPIDYVLISHDHYDHLDKRTVKALGNAPHWLVPKGLKGWFLKQGISHVSECNWWEVHRSGPVTITCAPAQHWSKRRPFDGFSSLWCGWAVEVDGCRFYFAGDSGFVEPLFQQIGDRLGPFDVAAIPIGGYLPRWFMRPYHIDPEEAVRIHQLVRSRFSFGIHWGTFVLTDEPILAPPKDLANAKERLGLPDEEFVTLPIGKTHLL